MARESCQSHSEAQTILKILHARLGNQPVKIHIRIAPDEPGKSFGNADLKIRLGQGYQQKRRGIDFLGSAAQVCEAGVSQGRKFSSPEIRRDMTRNFRDGKRGWGQAIPAHQFPGKLAGRSSRAFFEHREIGLRDAHTIGGLLLAVATLQPSLSELVQAHVSL